MTHDVALITDSTADIPDDLLAQYDILTVPMLIIWGQETLHDHVDLTAAAFYRRLEQDAVHPTTSQAPPQAFLEAYRAAEARGAREIVVITLSGELSGAVASARQAAELSPIPVQVVDSRNVTGGLGWQVLAAARARALGGAAHVMAERMIAAAADVRQRVRVHVVMDTLKYLHLGGRIGHASAFIGGLLNIKPLVQVSCQSGMVEPLGRERSRKRAIEALMEGFFRNWRAEERLHVALLHGDAPEDAEELAQRIREAFAPVELCINHTGPVLGVHTGPRALALAGYAE